MHYRKMGKTGEKVSALGFGAMRLPTIDGDVSQIDEAKAIEMIRYSIDNGVNYLDTAWPYHGGMSEALCGKVMQDGYRSKVKIATKLPTWEIKTHDDMENILDQQLERLGVEVIDFYLIHTIKTEFWKTLQECDYKSFLGKAKADGKIRHYGFSYHDNLDLFKEVVDDFDWEFAQIQLNYLDENYQAGLEGMHYAAGKGLGIVVMEPLRGGMLAKDEMPEELSEIWKSSGIQRSPAEWALRYLWNFPEVSVILSGMSTLDQVKENIAVADTALPESFKEKEKEVIGLAKDYFLSKIKVNCTNCRYCIPCPSGVYIPELFWAYNHDAIFGDHGKAKFWVNGFLSEDQRASNCIECGQCEEHCPQNIKIIDNLKKIAAMYEEESNAS